MINFSDFFMME